MTTNLSISPPSYAPLRAVDRRPAKEIFFVVILLVLTCVQGIRVANIPIPFALFFSIIYLIVFRPQIPATAPRLYAIVISYLLVVSTRNALSETGSVRDFLYVGICFTNLVLTLSLFDLFKTIEPRRLGMALLVVAFLEVLLQLLQYLDIGGFNSLVAPLMRFWASQTNSGAFLLPGALAERAPGTFGAPTAAGLILYLIIRGAAIVLRRRWMVYLGIIPIVIGGARDALVIFVVWEMFVQFFYHLRRNFAVAAMGFLLLCAGMTIFFIFPNLFAELFIFKSFTVSQSQFVEGFSVVNRIRSIEWAIQHWQEFLTFGGITSAEMTARITWQGSGVDSELILRSMQFGFMGFLCLLAANVWVGLFWKNPDSWFILFFALVSSLTNSTLSNFVLFPFVIIYSLCVGLNQTQRAERNVGELMRHSASRSALV